MKRMRSRLIEIGSSVLIFATLFPQPSVAQSVPQSSYEIVAIGNQASGNLVVNGDYKEAIQRISGSIRHYPFAATNNLCVVHTVLGQYNDALLFCDKAVEVAEWKSRPGPKYFKERIQTATITALAYSNRGVLRALLGDRTGAEDDFQAAIKHKDDIRAPVHNFARLSMDSSEPLVVVIRGQ